MTREASVSHSLLGADKGTHLKALAIALIAAALLIVVGLTARNEDTTSATARIDAPVLKAGKPAAYSSAESQSVH
jgi:hypothetical protein